GDLARSLAAVFEAEGSRVECPGREELDVRSAKAVEAYFEAREGISVLINNAGVTGDALLSRISPGDWDEVVDTNLKGAHLCSQAAARLMMRRRDGHIINIGSYSALRPPVGQS